MSGGSSANNSWTILTPEETVAETLRPLAEGKEHHEESPTSAAGSEENQPAKGTESAKGLPVEDHPVSEEKTAKLSGDTSTDQPASVPAAIPDDPVPTSLDVSSSLVPDSDALSQSEGLPEGPAQSSPDPDSFSDSYTHITPSSDEAPASLLSTETLGGVELTQEKETLEQEGAQHPLNGEGLQQEGEESDLSPTDLGKQADSPVDSEVAEESTKTGEEGEPEVRRRRSLLAALERIGRTEEEEEREEDFQLPHREEDSGFSVNKCILGAVILLGLGTIFFSGVFMNLDEESDYGTRELKDAELPGKQEWLNPEVPPPPVDADNTELLNKLAKGSEQISVLQAQLQAQREELKVAKVHAAEGAKEQLRLEEVEKENTAEAPVKAATSPSSGQPEASTQGTAGSTEKQPRKPSDEQWEKKKDVKKDKKDMGERKEGEKSDWKEGEKREWKDIGKTEWKKGKYEQGKFDKEQGKFDKEKDKEGKQKRHSDETKQWKEKEWKKGKASRGDEGKPWKDREGKNERIEKSERKEWKEEKELKKARHEKVNEGKQWRGKEEKRDWRAGKEHGEKPKSREEWKGEKEWRKGKDGYKESGKEKWAKKDLKEKGEKKEWQKDDWKSKNSKDHGKEGKWKGERKPWEESKNHDKERKGKDERKQWNENERKSKNGKDDKDWKRKDERKQWEKKEEQGKRGGQKEKKDWNKDKSSSQKHKDEHKLNSNHLHEEEHVWGERKPPHTHRRPSLEQPEYWVRQRDRLQDNPKPAQLCDSLETCAQAEGLLPVPFPDFEAILQTYLAKAEEAGVDASKREELQKLAAEFFKDGLFVHDQMSFTDFVEDLADVLEDMVEGDESDEEDSDIEDEMEEFEKEVLKKFSVPGAGAKEERSKGERRKESGRGRG
ncbi:pre-B-cell leukemia homeobox interacting protein 1b isoform X4 [Acanthopagrus latus]|uniref:pre-B-cell leukemia homeobox interacting protein 1b isoform X4 n=1 Tax=Acanthopagrus latus TaxID=8177 RepID=UPI00187C169E|nr:pre-B-cell leukemia homeobox interacting protein 1b isoform X4 [Acanthopagrus latus]